MTPELLSYADLSRLKKEHPELSIEDHIDFALDELFDIAEPSKKDTKTPTEVRKYATTLTKGNPETWGNWVYYPWLNKVVHMPPVDALRALRTSRNRNLITAQEQSVLYQATILIIGMSVGSNIVEALASQGIGSTLILVDMDVIEPSNLNRIRSPYHHVGLHKVEAIRRKVWEIDPYIAIESYEDGLTEENMATILDSHKPNIIVDEMDSLRMKVLLREAAKERSLPLIMAADDGDDALIDIERYDHGDNELFNGRIPEEVINRIKTANIPRAELGLLIGRYFVGAENIPLRMYESLSEVGKTLPSWPQLGGAAALSGVSIAYVTKKILLGEDMASGRVLVSLDRAFNFQLKPDQRATLAHYQQMLNQGPQ